MQRKVTYLIFSSSAWIFSFILLVKYESIEHFISVTFLLGFFGSMTGILIFSPIIIRETADKELDQRKYPNGTTKHSFCPKCGSSKIIPWSPPLYHIYHCKRCGYHGVIIVEDGILAQKVQSDYLRREKLDQNETTCLNH
ncbi:MAG: hypothetical protein ACFFCQ_06205 [Promethearchaeota archaeon]